MPGTRREVEKARFPLWAAGFVAWPAWSFWR